MCTQVLGGTEEGIDALEMELHCMLPHFDDKT